MQFTKVAKNNPSKNKTSSENFKNTLTKNLSVKSQVLNHSAKVGNLEKN